MNHIIFAVFVCILAGKAFTANIDDVCTGNAACTPDNSYCRKDFENCVKGECKCQKGYTSSNDKSKCLKDTAVDGDCSATTFCLYDAECDTASTNKCKCPSGKSYNSLLKLCVTTGIKAISETCSAVTECYGYSSNSADNKVECVAASGSSTKYCRCLSGYVTENYMCRKPHVTETCTTAVGCVVDEDLNDSSQETETCVSSTSKCTCPSTAEQVTGSYMGTTFKLCYTKYTDAAGEKADGETCTKNNECKTKFCRSCPGETTNTCVRPNGAVKIGVYSPFFLMVATLLASVFW